MSWSRRSSGPTSRPNATITARPRLRLANHQHRDPVPLAWLSALAQCAVRQLRIHQHGRLAITFIDGQTMRKLNRRFMRHDRLTDVLSFRYPHELVIGEVLIAPACARRYARQHKVPYRLELARYVIHGLLHWVGHNDRTVQEQRRMRALEDTLLKQCTR